MLNKIGGFQVYNLFVCLFNKLINHWFIQTSINIPSNLLHNYFASNFCFAQMCNKTGDMATRQFGSSNNPLKKVLFPSLADKSTARNIIFRNVSES